MALSNMKAMHKTQATRIFTDREKSRDSFYRSLNNYLSNISKLHVLMYYGIGGIGKTSLLEQLYEYSTVIADKNNLTIVNINLESSHLNNSSTCLFSIYKQLNLKSFCFEFALAKLWSIQGWSVQDIKKNSFSSDSFLYDLIEAGMESADAFMPFRLFHKLVESGNQLANKYKKQYRSDLKEINSLDEFSLEQKLPLYLGLSIEKEAKQNGRKFLFFFDTHESIVSDNNFKNTKHIGDWWLQELIGCAENGLYVIAGREYLKWEDSNPEWSQYLDQHILGSLSDKDADYFLSQIPIPEDYIRHQIIETAHGMPLYLDLCASTYLTKKSNRCEITVNDFKMDEDEVIKRFISHLEVEQAEALKAMALLEKFDRELFLALINGLNINFPNTLFKEFCSTSYTEPAPSIEGGHKIHSLVREFIYKNADKNNALEVINIILKHCSEKLEIREMKRTVWVFQQALHIIAQLKINISDNQSDLISNIGLTVIESGYWKDIGRAITLQFGSPLQCNTPSCIKFLMAVSLRKQGELTDAIDLYTEVLNSDIKPNYWRPLVEYYAAHSQHLTGKYNQALTHYQKIVEEGKYDTNLIVKHAHKLAYRQLTDIFMLQGKFQQAIQNFNKLLNNDDDIIWRLELLRFKGYVYRFNFMLNDAEKIYAQALKLSKEHYAEGMQGKILTNLAETLCWKSPNKAVSFADESIELNDDLNSPIEVGKALAAKSIALTNLNQYHEALNFAEQAISMQKNNGYLSGIVFGLQAKAIAEFKLNDMESFEHSYTSMQHLINKIDGCYQFLLLPLVYLNDNKQAFDEFKTLFDWLQSNNIDDILDYL